MKEIRWRGQTWTIRPATESERATWTAGREGVIMSSRALIIYDNTSSTDMQIMTLLHEAAHEMFPEWEAEPSNESRSELGVFERDLKAFLEAMGVDLTPMLRPDRKARK